jgi:pilus assembly protein FimV
LLLAGAVVTYSALASALGLGEITVHSALNQPLRADIELVDAAGLEAGELSVNLATADEFRRAGVDRIIFLNDLMFTPILRGNRRLVRVTSRKPVNEPFLNFLVQLNQANGRVLREYTLLIDPAGSPAIVPATDEPLASQPSSEAPSVQPAVTPPPARKAPTEALAAPAMDPLAEQLAASIVQNRQLQASIDELNAKFQAQDEQFAAEKKQVAELQSRLAAVQQVAAKPVEPEVAAAAPVIIEEPGTDRLLMCGLLMLVVLLVLAWLIRRRRQSFQAAPEPSAMREPVLSRSAEPRPEVLGKQVEIAAYGTQEASLRSPGFDPEKILEIHARHPRLNPVAPAAVTLAAAPGDEFQLNLDDLSMAASRDLTGSFENPPSTALSSSEWLLAQPEIEWVIEPVPQPQDSVLDKFAEPGRLPGLEPLHLAPPTNR